MRKVAINSYLALHLFGYQYLDTHELWKETQQFSNCSAYQKPPKFSFEWIRPDCPDVQMIPFHRRSWLKDWTGSCVIEVIHAMIAEGWRISVDISSTKTILIFQKNDMEIETEHTDFSFCVAHAAMKALKYERARNRLVSNSQ